MNNETVMKMNSFLNVFRSAIPDWNMLKRFYALIFISLFYQNLQMESAKRKIKLNVHGWIMQEIHVLIFLFRKIPAVLFKRFIGLQTDNYYWSAIEEIAMRTIQFYARISNPGAPTKYINLYSTLHKYTSHFHGLYVQDIHYSELGFRSHERFKCSAHLMTLDPTHSLGDEDLSLIIYFHGGGYCFGHSNMYVPAKACLLKEIQASSRMPQKQKVAILSVDYPLAPEAPHPIPTELCVRVAKFIKNKYKLTNFIIGGDSAGGALAVNASLACNPTGVILISPWVSHACETNSHKENADIDFIGGKDLIHIYSATHSGDVELSVEDHRLEVLNNPNLHLLPKNIFLSVGKKEVFHDDVLTLRKILDSHDKNITTVVGNDCPHIYPMLWPLFNKESTAALKACADFSAYVFWGKQHMMVDNFGDDTVTIKTEVGKATITKSKSSEQLSKYNYTFQ